VLEPDGAWVGQSVAANFCPDVGDAHVQQQAGQRQWRLGQHPSVDEGHVEAARQHQADEFAAERLHRMTDALQHVGLRRIRVRPLLLPARPDPSVFDGLNALLVRPENIAAVRPAIPASVPVIEFLNELDTASRQFLGEVFEDLRSRRPGSL
jgi:hypothetical protein